MTRSALYSLRTDGDQYRITKFTDGDVESTYLCTETECECPAGHRHTCRHRQMLPTMLAHRLANTHWFFDYDRAGAIVDFNGSPKHLIDQLEGLGREDTEQDTYGISPMMHDLPALKADNERVRNELAVGANPASSNPKPLPPGDYVAAAGIISLDGRVLTVVNVKPWRRM